MKYFAILALVFTFAACSDDDNDYDAPECVKVISDDFARDACSGSGDLTRWNFDGEDVYCFNLGTCYFDSTAEIYDVNCTLLCILGGVDGNTICQGLEWGSNAVLEETLLRY